MQLASKKYIHAVTSVIKTFKKGLIDIKNQGNNFFCCCQIRQLNLINKDVKRSKKSGKEMVANLDYKGIEFPVSNISYHKTESKNNININVFRHQKKLK